MKMFWNPLLTSEVKVLNIYQAKQSPNMVQNTKSQTFQASFAPRTLCEMGQAKNLKNKVVFYGHQY